MLALAWTAPSPAQEPDRQAAPKTVAEEETPSETKDAGEAAPVAPPQIRENAGRIQYVGPDTYILLDAQGRSQPVPGMTYEDFLQAWKKSQLASKPATTSRFVIENIDLDGTTRDGFAELDFQATVRLLVDEQVDVPLGLIGAILQGKPRISTVDDLPAPKSANADSEAGRARVTPQDFVTQTPDDGGVVAHLTGVAGDRRRIELKIIAPLSRDGAEVTLQLSCARAVSSNFTLTTRSPVTDPNVNSGALVKQDPDPAGGTRLQVAGPVGPFRLTWHSAENMAPEYAPVLSAAGAIRVTVDGRSVRSDAKLQVQSYGGSFDRFRVRLPPGAQLLPAAAGATSQSPKYRVSLERAPNGAVAANAAQVAIVEFPQKQLAPVTVDLATEQPIGLKGEGSAVELAGFEVLGAVRQFGDVALQVADDWQARWQIGQNVRQVDAEDLEASLQQPNVSAAFQYDRQPWSLGVRVEARATRIHVTPQYEVQYLPDEARLTLRLNYQIDGKRAFEFRIRMEGWAVAGSPLASGGLVDLNQILRPGADGTLTLPLAQASTPRAEITLSLRRSIPRDQQPLELPLPVPIADSIGTGDLIVRASPDVELRPDLENSIGLAPATVVDSSDSAIGNGAELHFRTVGPDPVLVAGRISRAQKISADVTAHVEITTAAGRVDQQFDYDVQHVPVKELLFEAPNELWFDDSPIEVALTNTSRPDEANADTETPLSIVPAPEDLEIANAGVTTQFRVPLPQPRLGQFTVHVRYGLTRPSSSDSSAWQLPLVRMVDVPATRSQANVSVSRGSSVSLDSKPQGFTWKVTSAISGTDPPGSLSLVADRSESRLPLLITASDFNPASATVIDRIWLQSWFSGGWRQDRAAIRFRTASSQATVELPPQTPGADIEVLLDGDAAQVLSRSNGRIVVRLSSATDADGRSMDATPSTYTLELRSRQPVHRSLLTRHQLTPPQLVGGKALSQVYWQIVLPGDEHVVHSPARMSSASQWQWLGGFWGERPVLSQTDLEEWADASEQPAPSAAQNEYLYTGLAPVVSIDLITAPRWIIVLAASSVVLVGGLLWIYLPVVRRRWILIAAACMIAGLAVAFPVPAALLAQAASVGVIVALLAALLRRATARPTHWPVTLPTGSSQRQVTTRSESILAPPPAMSAASTAPTVPLRVSDSQS
jgi:hypothetical protein